MRGENFINGAADSCTPDNSLDCELVEMMGEIHTGAPHMKRIKVAESVETTDVSGADAEAISGACDKFLKKRGLTTASWATSIRASFEIWKQKGRRKAALLNPNSKNDENEGVTNEYNNEQNEPDVGDARDARHTTAYVPNRPTRRNVGNAGNVSRGSRDAKNQQHKRSRSKANRLLRGFVQGQSDNLGAVRAFA